MEGLVVLTVMALVMAPVWLIAGAVAWVHFRPQKPVLTVVYSCDAGEFWRSVRQVRQNIARLGVSAAAASDSLKHLAGAGIDFGPTQPWPEKAQYTQQEYDLFRDQFQVLPDDQPMHTPTICRACWNVQDPRSRTWCGS
jgi:hypothetical protein